MPKFSTVVMWQATCVVEASDRAKAVDIMVRAQRDGDGNIDLEVASASATALPDDDPSEPLNVGWEK